MATSFDLDELQEGYLVDYDMATWEVRRHASYDRPAWPADQWTLENGDDVLVLEHEYDDGDVFRLLEPGDLSEVVVDGEPFLSVARDKHAPSAIEYQGIEYVLVEEDARTVPKTESLTRSRTDDKILGVCAGLAKYVEQPPSLIRIAFILAVVAPAVIDVSLCVFGPGAVILYGLLGFAMPKEPPPSPADELTHYWVYEDDDEFVALECVGESDWSVYVGHRVEPYEFDNILPRSES